MSLVIETRLLNMLLLHNETCQLQWGTTPLMRKAIQDALNSAENEK